MRVHKFWKKMFGGVDIDDKVRFSDEYDELKITDPHTGVDKVYKIPITVTFNDDDTYTFRRMIGQGSYGAVLQYHDDRNDKFVVVKVGKIDGDIQIANDLNRRKTRCNDMIVPTIVRGYEDEELLIMDSFHGDLTMVRDQIFKLSKINREKAAEHIISVFYQIVNSINCLFEAGFVYTDIKLQNFLYKKTKDNNYFVVIGDIGSAYPEIKKDEAYMIFTFPPFENKKDLGMIHEEEVSDKSLVWGLGIIFIDLLLVFSPNKLYHLYIHSNMENMTEIEHNKFVKLVTETNKFKNMNDLIRKMLEIDLDKRIGLKELLGYMKCMARRD